MEKTCFLPTESGHNWGLGLQLRIAAQNEKRHRIRTALVETSSNPLFYFFVLDEKQKGFSDKILFSGAILCPASTSKLFFLALSRPKDCGFGKLSVGAIQIRCRFQFWTKNHRARPPPQKGPVPGRSW